MASSVARLPTGDWRDHSRIAAAVFAHPSFSENLKIRIRIPSSPSSSSSSSASSTITDDDTNPSRQSDTACSSPSHHRTSRIADRWAAREMASRENTIERRVHQEEISALASSFQPVSARAASFLREASPALSECSATSVDLPPYVRASSLIQRWREIEAEAEAGPAPTPRTSVSRVGSSVATATSSPPDERSGVSAVCDYAETFGDSDSDAATSELANAASLSESEGSRVGHIVRLLSSESRTQSFKLSSSNESELPPRQSQGSDPRMVFGGRARVRIRRRQEFEELMARMVQERRMELNALAERHYVSRFSHRGRIQALLRLMFLRRQVAAQARGQDISRPSELNQLQSPSTIVHLRHRFSHRGEQNTDDVLTLESSGSSLVNFAINSQDSCDTGSNSQFCRDKAPCEEVVSSRVSECTPPEVNSPRSGSEDLREASPPPDFLWEERSLDGSDLDWGRPLDSSFHGWQCDVEQEAEPCIEQQTRNMEFSSTSLSNQWTGSEVNNQVMDDDFLEKFGGNSEIREILRRRPVSTTLASDFRERMDRVLLSLLQRQQCYNENFAEEYEDQPVWRRSDEFHDVEQVPSLSYSLPLPYQTSHHPKNWQHASLSHQSSQHSLEMELRHDLRSDITQIHQEIRELRKLVEACMKLQMRLQHSITQEVSDAVMQSVRTENTSMSSNWAPPNKGNCCICDVMPADSLLYRCGHMCTCFKCARELQWSRGRCPICRVSIVDVVRVHAHP